jgi:acylphosphatase
MLASNSTNEAEGKSVAMTVARRFVIRGDVQGVGYRFFGQRAAARHQVVGYIKNKADGTVEAHVEGEARSVEAFKHDLATGPQFASVEQVEEIVIEPTGLYSSFRIDRDANS